MAYLPRARRRWFGFGSIGGVLVALGVLLVGSASASAAPDNQFCVSVMQASVAWPFVNLDYPGQPFFQDGNADGFADQLVQGHDKLPALADTLDELATQATTDDLRANLHAVAAAIRQFGSEAAPTTAEASQTAVDAVAAPAAAIQDALEAQGCRAAPAGTQGQDQSDMGGGWDPVIVGLAIGAFVIAIAPMVYVVVYWLRRRGPVSVAPSGDRLAGRLSGWAVSTFTGRVKSVHIYTRTTGTVSGGHTSVDGSTSPVTASISTSVHQTVLLSAADGREVSFETLGGDLFADQVVTLCAAERHGARVNFAVLNHSTHTQHAFAEEIKLIQLGRRKGCLFILIQFVGVLGLLLFTVGLALILVPIAWLLNRKLGQLGDTGPLWRNSAAEAQDLLRV
ncbi:hypothetical protein ACH3VR_07730 [Microbacterium sp. B2969]|uniref:DUF4349 domain-containing protein n=1 Tax=Microbacterium alkaliflavum TaxID=3248839 RepID=A0ABW7Q5V1_9MICO